MIRAYEVKGHLNRAKEQQVRALFKPYRQTAVVLAGVQLRHFFQQGRFHRDLDIKGIKSALSERYKETLQYQVVGVFNSFFSNRANDFRRYVLASTVDNNGKGHRRLGGCPRQKLGEQVGQPPSSSALLRQDGPPSAT